MAWKLNSQLSILSMPIVFWCWEWSFCFSFYKTKVDAVLGEKALQLCPGCNQYSITRNDYHHVIWTTMKKLVCKQLLMPHSVPKLPTLFSLQQEVINMILSWHHDNNKMKYQNKGNTLQLVLVLPHLFLKIDTFTKCAVTTLNER